MKVVLEEDGFSREPPMRTSDQRSGLNCDRKNPFGFGHMVLENRQLIQFNQTFGGLFVDRARGRARF